MSTLTPAQQSLLQTADPRGNPVRDSDRKLFRRLIGDFVPDDSFDAHAHLYNLSHLVPDARVAPNPEIGLEQLIGCMQQWMNSSVVENGLYFAFPVPWIDAGAANQFVFDAIRNHPGSRGLMLIRPDDDPAATEETLLKFGFSGFKVYHVFAERTETFLAEQHEFLPDWAWELADRYGLAIMMHMVLPTALQDVRNQTYIVERCHRFRNAKLILAHAARGFNARHTVHGIDAIRGLPNVWFDTSAICEPAAFEAILSAFGTTRLMYGSDFPVSELRGRCISAGDGFYWLHDHNAEWNGWLHARPELVGIESLAALKQACRRMHLKDSDVERIFCHNAREMLGISTPPATVQQKYRSAKEIIPGGTQLLSKRPEMFAPEQWPAYYEQAIGCEMTDIDGRRYIDMSSSGILTCLLGFADPDVNAAVIRRIQMGSMCTQQTTDELRLAELLCDIHPWATHARFSRSGGEAMAIAVRIARAATRRSAVIVCGYHGWHDWYLAANLNSEGQHQLDNHLLPGLQPSGVPEELSGTVVTFRYNCKEEFDAAVAACGGNPAAVVMEPSRSIDPEPGFLEHIRERTSALGVPLIFDEISSGWRYCLGGIHRLFDVEPDIAVFAKAMSNGFPMSAVIGRGEVMNACHDSFISSTYWTEGTGPAAAVAAIEKMKRINVPAHVDRIGQRIREGWLAIADRHSVRINVTGRNGSCSLAFETVDAQERMTLFTTEMLDHGFLAGPGVAPTLAHQDVHVDRYLEAVDAVFSRLSGLDAGGVIAELRGPVRHTTFQRLVN